jgi:(2Fe-2S) ferredoxin
VSARSLHKTEHHLLLCNGKNCKKAGAKAFHKAVEREISSRNCKQTIQTTRTRCLERCKDKCAAVDYPAGTWYRNLTEDDAAELVDTLLNQDLWPEKTSYTTAGGELRASKRPSKKKKSKTK